MDGTHQLVLVLSEMTEPMYFSTFLESGTAKIGCPAPISRIDLTSNLFNYFRNFVK